jgi:hypothetical protein
MSIRAGLKFRACPIKGSNGWLDAVHEEDRKAILYRWENATGKSEKHCLNIVL